MPPTRRRRRCWRVSTSCAASTPRRRNGSGRSRTPIRSARRGWSWRCFTSIWAGGTRRRPGCGCSSTGCSVRRTPSTCMGRPAPRGPSAATGRPMGCCGTRRGWPPTTPRSRPSGATCSGRSTIRRRPRSPTSRRWRSTRTGAPALLGMARALADTNPPQASAAAGRAIEIDPDYLDAHLFLAQRSLDDRDHEAGRASLDRALAINDRSLEARSLVAAVAYVEDRLEDFETEVRRVLEINPTYGENLPGRRQPDRPELPVRGGGFAGAPGSGARSVQHAQPRRAGHASAPDR